MSTEKFHLANLPVECLEPIVRLISAYDVGHLWLTGNIRIQYLLSEGGGVREFHYSHETTYPLLWPRMMTFFPRLSSISILVNLEKRFQRTFDIDMSTLPRNIDFLNLKFARDLSSFKKSFEDDPSRYSNLKLLHLAGEEGKSPVDIDLSSLIALTSFGSGLKNPSRPLGNLILPPYLTQLTAYLGIKDLPTLPSTLTDVSLLFSTATPSLWQHLPRGLLHLRIKYNSDTLFPPDFNDLPPNLISIVVRQVEFLKRDMFSKLPISLRHLKIKSVKSTANRMLEQMFPLLPRNLETIDGSIIPYGMASNLAKLLPVGLRNQFRTVGAGSLQHLPIKTESFISATVFVTDFEHLGRFCNLHKLICSEMNLEYLKILPRTLKILHMYPHKKDLLVAHVLELPQGLTAFSVSPAGIEKEAWQWLPRGLTTLGLARWFGGIESHLAALQLPRTLTYFQMIPLKASKQFLENLPLTLTELEISVAAEDLAWCETLSRFKLLRQLHIGAVGQCFSNARRVLQNLPRRLTDLKMTSDQNDLRNEDLTKFLPPGLVRLNIAYSPNITLSVDNNDHEDEVDGDNVDDEDDEDDGDDQEDDLACSNDVVRSGSLPPFLSFFYKGN